MQMDSTNSYSEAGREKAYNRLEFGDTYHLAFRDIPGLISKYVKGKKALDFGCGTGRSTRFLQRLGLDTTGIDIASNMLQIAREKDPEGNYVLIRDGDFIALKQRPYDLIFSAFTFDNISGMDRKISLFSGLRGLLHDDGIMINLVSSPDMYVNEWASFSTKDYPENRKVKSGGRVKIIITGIGDNRPVEDIVWSHGDYLKVYGESGMRVVETLKPLATGDEPYAWKSETKIAPWVIYVLRKG